MADTLKNPQGHNRTFEDNKMILLALWAALNRRISLLNVNQETTINWRSIEDEVGRDFHVSNKYVHDLRTGELQPIEMSWGCGKNHVALNHCYDMKMKDVVHYLREG